MSWGSWQSGAALDPCGLWPKVTEEREGTGFNRLKGNYCVWRPGCASNHSSTSLSPSASQGHKIRRVFTVQKSLRALLPHPRGSLPLIITQTIFSRAQQSCPLQLVCLLLALLSPSALRWFYVSTGGLPPSLPPSRGDVAPVPRVRRQAQPPGRAVRAGRGIPAPPRTEKALGAAAVGSGIEL